MTTKKWSDEAVATLMSVVGNESPVSAATVERAAKTLGEDFSIRSVSSKLRQLEREVASTATAKTPSFTADEGDSLSRFVQANAGNLTYKEIAANFAGGKFNPKQIQGKLLALELTRMVRPTDKVEAARTYTEAQENQFVAMANGGAFIEDIAAALGKEVPSVRGKALSLTRNGQISKIPAQRESHAKNVVDPVEALGDKIATMTVAEIAAAVDKTERGLKTLLTRRGIKVADYDGAAKRQKAEAKAVA